MQNITEQNAQLEKKIEILSRSSMANENQVRLLQEDLEALRIKLETKNQQLEGKDKGIKKLETELSDERNKAVELTQTIQVSCGKSTRAVG